MSLERARQIHEQLTSKKEKPVEFESFDFRSKTLEIRRQLMLMILKINELEEAIKTAQNMEEVDITVEIDGDGL